MNSLKKTLRYLGVAILGFVIGGVSLYVHRLRSGPPLELWHSVQLTSEFSVDRLGEIANFEDYLVLEDQLFAELDAKVYARTATGAHLALARYSGGSVADPRGFERDWNRSFELPAESPRGGVLLLHGMSDSPYSLRALGESLNARGFWVVGLRLPGARKRPLWPDDRDLGGHGGGRGAGRGSTSARSRERMRFTSSATRQELRWRSPHARGDERGARRGASEPRADLAGDRGQPRGPGASWLRLFSAIPGLEKLAWTQIVPEFDPFKYNSFAVNAGDQVHRLTRRVTSEIEKRSNSEPIAAFPRTLVFLSTVDATVTAAAVIDNLLEHLPPTSTNSSSSTSIEARSSRHCSSRTPRHSRRPSWVTTRSHFHLTIVGNENAQSDRVVGRRKGPFSTSVSSKPLRERWPPGAISLSHVALPFPSDDPLYGARPADSDDVLHLGDIAFQGERGLLLFPADWLLRLRHNPFYSYLEQRALTWVDADPSPNSSARPLPRPTRGRSPR